MDFTQKEKEIVQGWIEEALKPIRDQLEKLENDLEKLEGEIEACASETHYHGEYASVDHVEWSENSFNQQISQLLDELNTLEYRVSDAERKAEQAQRAADSASRSSGGYY